MDIKSVIQRHGYQLQVVSARMEVKHSTLSGMLSGNPTIGTLRKIVDAINTMNEENKVKDRCYIAEFFADELPSGFTLKSSSEIEAENEPAVVQQPAAETSPADELPFDHQPEPEKQAVQTGAAMQEPLICPHCGQAFIVEVKKIANPD